MSLQNKAKLLIFLQNKNKFQIGIIFYTSSLWVSKISIVPCIPPHKIFEKIEIRSLYPRSLYPSTTVLDRSLSYVNPEYPPFW